MSRPEPQLQFGQVIADPGLLGEPFAQNGDATSWSVWTVVVRAALGEELSRSEKRLLAKVAGGRKPPKGRVNELWAIVGRRGGKSRAASAVGVYLGCFVDYSSVLAPGETGHVVIVATDKQQAGVIFRYVLGLLEASETLKRQIVRTTTSEIDLQMFGVPITITVVSNSYRSIRGRTLVACVFEEVAFWRDDDSATPDIETHRAVMPSLATTGGMLVGISSPHRRAGLLYKKWAKSFGKDDSRVLVVQGASRVFNNTLPKSVVDDAMADDPIAAKAEWLGEFRDDVTGYLEPELVASLARAAPLELPPRPDIQYTAFADASGGRGDAFAIAVAHLEDDKIVIDACRATSPPFDPGRCVEDYCKLLRDYGLRKITGDNYSAGWVAGAFKDNGIRYEVSKTSASDIYREALPSFVRGLVELPDDPKLLAELGSLERKTAPSGKETITHPVNAHDDRANVVAGCVNLLAGRRRPSDIDYERDSIIAGELQSAHAGWDLSEDRTIYDRQSRDVISDYYPGLAQREPWEL